MARSFTATSSQSISVASAPSINFGTGDFTVFAWVRFPVEPPNAAMIVGKRAGGFDGDEGWELKINDGGNETFRWDVETDLTGRVRAEATLTGINDGNWHLIAGDHFDNAPTGQLRLWYDGAIAATSVANTPGTVDTTTPMVIAAAYDTPNTNYLTGEIGLVFGCDRLLGLAEHQMMAAGFSPRFLNPRPCFLMELTSRTSPEPDIGAGGLFGTLENAPPYAIGPTITYPRSADIGQDLWYEFGNATVTGQSALTATVTRGRTATATVVGQSTATATVTRARAGASTCAGQSALTADISALVPASATVAGQSALTADMSPEAPLEAAVAGQSALTATANINAIVGSIPCEGQSALTAALSANVPASATLGGQSTLTATMTPSVPLDATVAGQSALTATGDRIRTLTSTIAGQSSLSASATISAGASATVQAQSSLTAATSATVPAESLLAAQSGLTATLTAGVPAAATVVGTSALTAALTRAQPASATVVGQSTLTADPNPRVPVESVVAAQSSLTATLSATVPLQATVDAQSSLRARPTFPGVKKTITVGGVARWLATVGGRITR